MSEPASISSGIAERYATAVFDLSKDAGGIANLQKDLEALGAAMDGSDDLKALLHSPIYTRDQQEAGISAIASKLGLSELVSNTLRLMAQKRRLFVVPQLVKRLGDMIAEDQGLVTAEVTSAKPLTKTQSEKLAATLKAKMGQDIQIKSSVDESIIGGLIVKVGSKMIDTSIASKLASLQNSMKEVG